MNIRLWVNLLTTNFDILSAFSTQIYCGAATDFDDIQTELRSCIGDIDFNMVSGWGNTHYLSDPSFNSNLIKDFNLEKFSKEVDIHVGNYISGTGSDLVNTNYNIISSWFALFKRGNYAHIHNHGDADIAGVYYFKKSGDDGNLFFCTPNKAEDTSILFKKGRVVTNPKEGEFILFPGYLDHGVQTNDTDEERVSLSFNIYFDR